MNSKSDSKINLTLLILKTFTKKSHESSPKVQNISEQMCVHSFFKNSGAAVSRVKQGLGITVTFSVAWECVGMAWLMQIIIAGESQLLWSSWLPQGPSLWNEMHYRILCASFWQRFVFPLCWSPSLSANSQWDPPAPQSPRWLGWASAPQCKEVVPLGKADELHSPLFVFSLYWKQSPFILALLKHPPQSVSLNVYRMNKLGCRVMV